MHYVGVAYRSTILCGYSKNDGNFADFISKILKYLKYGRYILTYKDNEIFYVKDKQDKGLVFLCIANEDVMAVHGFVCLERMREDFNRFFTKEEFSTTKTNSLNREFQGKLERHFVGS